MMAEIVTNFDVDLHTDTGEGIGFGAYCKGR